MPTGADVQPYRYKLTDVSLVMRRETIESAVHIQAIGGDKQASYDVTS